MPFDLYKDDSITKSRRLRNFFTIARFGPDSIFILGFLGAVTLILWMFHFDYLSAAAGAVSLLVFSVESAEMISLDKVQARQLVGRRCQVVKAVSKGERGIVRLFNSDGFSLEGETWSANSDTTLREGSLARVVGIESIILTLEPIQD